MDSQTRDGTDAIPRRKRCFPLLKLFGQGYDYENARNYPRQPWDARKSGIALRTADSNSASWPGVTDNSAVSRIMRHLPS